MSSRPTSAPQQTIGIRLALFYTVCFAVSFVLLFIVYYQIVEGLVESRDREVIQAQTEQFSTLCRQGGIPAVANYFSQQITPSNSEFVRIVDRYNHVRFSTASHPAWILLDLRMRQTGDLHTESRWDMLTRDGTEESWIVGTQPLGNGLFLQGGRSNAASQRVLAHMRRTGLEILLPSLSLSLLGGWLVARSVRAPLRALVETTRHILETGDFKRRVPVQSQRGELGALGAMFNDVLDRNDKLVQSSRETLDNVAHDLRTPMTHLRNSAEHALEAEPDLRLQREALSDCMEESEHILQLLNTLMDLSEAQSGEMALLPTQIALRELTDEVIELYSIVAEERSIGINNEIPTYLSVEADRMHLRQCLANLLDNALKYSAAGTTVTLSGKTAENGIELMVIDQGCGIAEEDIDRIWDRLYRAEPSRAEPGLGLGLSLVKAIAEAHGGTVHVESRTGEGSAFTLRLPRTPPAQGAVGTPPRTG